MSSGIEQKIDQKMKQTVVLDELRFKTQENGTDKLLYERSKK